MAPADPRGLAGPGRLGRAHVDGPAGVDGRGQHVPQPGPHGQARGDPRPHQRRPGGPRHRRGLVRARARRVRDRLRGRASASGSTGSTRRSGSSDDCSTARRVDHDGPAYRLHEAALLPRPIQAHLPILIGGSGPKKTLRTVARYGDGWNTVRDDRRRSLPATRSCGEHCADVGRDPADDRAHGQLPDRHPRPARRRRGGLR